MEIEYWIWPHSHPLRLRENLSNGQLTCEICAFSSVSGAPFYTCDLCSGFYMHKSCGGLPYQIKHPIHSHSVLTLSPRMSNLCRNCNQHIKDASFYSCVECRFCMDAECALMPLVTSGISGRDWFLFGHHHPLLLLQQQQRTGGHVKCFLCNSTSHGSGDHQELYGCFKCSYFVHMSCANIPREIYHPFHRYHRGALLQSLGNQFVCGICKFHSKERYNFSYGCNKCSLYLCLKCAEVAWTSCGSVKYEYHDHLLCLLENVKVGNTTPLLSRCNAHNSYCTQHVVMSSNEFKQTESSMFWCYQCGFRIHLLCAPLPSILKHEFHIHSLFLVDSMHEDDSGEYYCDVCETKRDPLIRLYCCQDCKYFAHAHCLFSEIVKILSGDLANVELKIVGQDIWKLNNNALKVELVDPAVTLKSVLNSINEAEKWIIRSYYEWQETSNEEDRFEETQSSYSFKVGDEEIDYLLHLSHFNHGNLKSLCSSIHQYGMSGKIKLELKPGDLKLVMVNGYVIPHSLAAVLIKLFYEFGDIGIARHRSIAFNSFVLFIICKVVNEMYITIPKCITKELVRDWYFNLRFARRQNFNVDFACAKLEQLIHALLGFEAERLAEEIPSILSQKIDEHRLKLNELQWKLDKCKEYRGPSSKSEYMEFCLKKASELNWKMNVYEDKFSQKRSTQDIQWLDGIDLWLD